MEIQVVAGSGCGKTPLSAFDRALYDAGIHNYNLVYLSSIIPARTSVVKKERYEAPDLEYGHRLYVVRAEIRSAHLDYVLCAGLGWYQLEDDQRGVFVEHELIGKDEKGVVQDVESRIRDSVTDLMKLRGYPLREEKIQMQLSTVKVTQGQAASALVAAVYTARGWK